jgi:hypothetical protein|eukprot:5652455-Prymnesium_polylepis.1
MLTFDVPFAGSYRGVIALGVQGWTHHHAITKVRDQWLFYYHDAARSGVDYLRDVRRPVPLTHLPNGSIWLATLHQLERALAPPPTTFGVGISNKTVV